MFNLKLFILCCFVFICVHSYSQKNIAADKIISIDKLPNYLNENTKKQINIAGNISTAELAKYFRTKFSERYFYDWQNFNVRFKYYNTMYPNQQNSHANLAIDHLNKFNDSTHWQLPFNYLNGEPVNAYALRHLARQHKMVDIAFYHNNTNTESSYVKYFVNQMQSLNAALETGLYEKIEDGNGIYEAFRSGYRVLNWLQIHNMFLSQNDYTDENQLTTIATLLQHGAHLYKTNSKFHSGNHQTRGLSALAIISILLRDFQETDIWYNHAMSLLQEHLINEINEDGFQFERSVHYHISDIGNYYYVYQLAKLSNMEVSDFWENKLKSLFTTLIKIAYPDKTAPVLQDDTDNPLAEKNEIASTLTLGYLLFEDPVMGYFANNTVTAKMYWYLNKKQLSLLENIKTQKPNISSTEFATTGYYIMRQGWNINDNMMIVSAGLDAKKPDHQHGDMLGVQAMANGHIILPNYQVSYPLTDFVFFKNSMVKNVALVDNELQGKKWTSNKGGSGFGKFKDLPEPSTIKWDTNKYYDLYVGSHNGFENIDVEYSRQVLYLKNHFWIIKDNFKSTEPHTYKQIWQGHYSLENQPNLIRASFNDASGCDIYQLIQTDTAITSGARGKNWSVVSKKEKTNFSFITIVYPFSVFSKRIDEQIKNPDISEWKQNQLPFKAAGQKLRSLTNKSQSYCFNITQLYLNNTELNFASPSDVFINVLENNYSLSFIGDTDFDINLEGKNTWFLNGVAVKNKIHVKVGDILKTGK